MYGGPSKLGRAAGAGRGGGAKRGLPSSFPPPSHHRSSGPSPGSRLSVGGGSANPRNRAAPSATSAHAATEETFSLVSGNNSHAFAMMIRLVPDLVDEIKRVEAQGGKARIKFDPNANNTSGNVIDVGGKVFRFTWSREFGDLCDIYEERQSGEDGNGLLVESGCAWRKLNVQRILDESTTNHVKMRSEEAERKLKARKAIVLDHGNPSMKSQIKQLVAVETNPWRHYKQKKETPFKKRKVEPPQVPVAAAAAAPPKSAYKHGLSSMSSAKNRLSASPLPSSPDQSGAAASPSGTVNVTKSNVSIEDIRPAQVTRVENAVSSEKEIHTRATSAVKETPGHKGNTGAKPMDLQSILIALLMENPKGVSRQVLEKAVKDTIPNSVRKIEPIIQKIATLQAPGRYFLKQGIELEGLKKPSSESGSSPEDNHQQTPASEVNRNQTPALEPTIADKIPTDELEEQAQPNSGHGDRSNALERIDIQHHSPDPVGGKKDSDNSEGRAGSSSDSGSDSDTGSDSSDSGSDSGSHAKSRSRSRSPVGSGSVSSSDSESDASSNSKEGPDEDVDIMTSDDDKEPTNKLQVSEPGFSVSVYEGRPVQDRIDRKLDGPNAVEFEKDLPNDEHETEMAVISSLDRNKVGEKMLEEPKYFSTEYDELQQRQNFIGSLFEEKENAGEDNFRQEQSDSSEKISKGKSGRGSSDLKHFDEKSERVKRLKTESLAQPIISGDKGTKFSESRHNLSPDRPNEHTFKGPITQMVHRNDTDGNSDFGLQKGYNEAVPGKSSSDLQQSSRRSFDQGASKAPETAERRNKHSGSLTHGRNHSEKSSHVHEGFPMQKEKAYRDNQSEDGYASDKKVLRNFKESSAGSKQSTPFDSHYRKHGGMVGKLQEAGQVSNLLLGSSPKDNNRSGVDKPPVVNGRDRILQREPSDLELGELREPFPEETPIKKQFERKSSFKQSENKVSISDNWNSDSNKGKPVGKVTLDSGKISSNTRGFPSNLDGSSKKRTSEHHAEDLDRSHHRVQPQPSNLSRVDNAEVGSQFIRLTDVSSKSRQNEAGGSQSIGLEGYGETHKKASGSAPQHRDTKHGLVSKSIRESRTQTSNTVADVTDGLKDTILAEGNDSSRKRRDSSSDETSCSYSKYEKDEPELKGPIKDFSQYKEYLQEYHDKYDSYCSLNKILESFRNEFHKLGKDLEQANGRDMDRYYNILGQLKESYNQCGTRHKRLKKIFVILHEELKHIKQRIKDYAHSYTKD